MNTRLSVKNTALAACLLLGITAHAQFNADYLKAADRYFEKSDYASAAAWYEKFFNGDSKATQGEFGPYSATTSKKKTVAGGKQTALYHLAESYRLLKDFTKAAPLYAQLADTNTTQFPLLKYHYATSLRALGQYSEAEDQLNQFLGAYHQQDQYSENAKREIANLRFIRQQLQKKENKLYAVQAISGGKEGASYAPVQLDNNSLLFTATWPDSSAPANKIHTNRLYQATYTQGTLSGVRRANLPSNQLHEGAATISSDGNTIYLTKWATTNGKKTAAIYISTKAGTNTWTNPVALDTAVNTPGANTQQPFLMPGGTQLLFASDRKDGFGGYDLWQADLDAAGKPTNVRNLGNTVNSSWNEQAPYYHAASATLVFTSDGRTGMGGYDLFFSKSKAGSWTQPENFGYPVNSIKDDMYFSSYSNGNNILENVVLSSDRADVCCLELFSLQKKTPVVALDTIVAAPVVVVKEKTPTVEEVKILENVYYEFGKATVTLDSYAALDAVADMLQKRPSVKVEIGGHTDNKGSDELNQKLSEQRAANVVAYLVNKGIDKNRLTAKGYGASMPIAPNKNDDGSDNPEGREKNRRTEMKILE